MTIEIQRAAVVKEAMSWAGTKYHHMGRVKGAGVDCLTLLAETYHGAGLIPKVVIPYYPKDFMLNSADERYLDGLLKYAKEIPGPPLPGDIVLWKFGRCFSHGAIVIDWPLVLHAHSGRNCTLEDANACQGLAFDKGGKARAAKFFSFWGE